MISGDDVVPRLDRLRGEIENASWPSLIRALRDAADELLRARIKVNELTDAIHAIDAKATPYGPPIVEDGQEFVGMYLMPVGPLHRALGLVGGSRKIVASRRVAQRRHRSSHDAMDGLNRRDYFKTDRRQAP